MLKLNYYNCCLTYLWALQPRPKKKIGEQCSFSLDSKIQASRSPQFMDQETAAHRQVQLTACFCMTQRFKLPFTFLNVENKPKEENCFVTCTKYVNSNFVSINKVLLKHNYINPFIECLWPLQCYNCKGAIIMLYGQQYLSSVFLQKKFADPLPQVIFLICILLFWFMSSLA